MLATPNTPPTTFKVGHVVFKCEMLEAHAVEGHGEYTFELTYD